MCDCIVLRYSYLPFHVNGVIADGIASCKVTGMNECGSFGFWWACTQILVICMYHLNFNI